MRVLLFVRRHPIALLGVFAAVFVAWIWRGSFTTDPAGPENQQVRSTRQLPRPFADDDGLGPIIPPELEKPKPSAQVISKLKPGMTRAEVEGLVGAPAAGDIHPATVADGRVTYHTTYEADFGAPPTVRPIRTQRVPPPPIVKDRTLVVLEFDATKPGHPLLGIHYPDPLF